MGNLSATTRTMFGDDNIFDQICGVLARHIDAKPHHIVGIALWVLHTHKYRQYRYSPRLSIQSPVKNCGKSTVLSILDAMAWNPKRITDPTVAVTIRLAFTHTLLLDEVDNMSIVKSMKAVLNDGYEAGKSVSRVIKGESAEFPIYGPVAFAGIGRLPATLTSRSLVVHMFRSTNIMERFIPNDAFYAGEIERCMDQINLNPDPPMPIPLGRDADNWRPLLAVANALNRGELAYRTMREFLNESNDVDIKESLLRDTEKVFTEEKTNVLSTDVLLDKLLILEDAEVDYSEHRLTKSKIARMLRDFQIDNRPHRLNRKLVRCWFKSDFEEMWKRFA